MTISNLLLALGGTILLLLCGLILLSNSRKPVNRALAAFLASGFLWLMLNLLTNISTDANTSLWFARLTLVGGVFMPFAFLLFSKTFVDHRSVSRGYIVRMLIVPLVLLVFTPTSLNIVSSKGLGEGEVIGPLYIFFIGYLIAYFTWGFIILLRFYKNRANPLEKVQLQYIFIGTFFTVIPALIANAILPLIGYGNAALYGPNAVIIISIFLSLAIIRHRLLDVRLIVVRSLGYVLSLVTIASISFVTLNYLSSLLDQNNVSKTAQKTIFVALTLVLAASYLPSKRAFDRLTKKLFYRDAYETQDLLNEFNQAIVSTIDLIKLLKVAGITIEKYLKPQSISFALVDGEADTVRVVSEGTNKISKESIEQIRAYVRKSPKKLFITDELDDKQNELRLLMQEADIGMLARITTNASAEGAGYVVMGYKKSGNMYNTQDAGAMEILSNELAIAVQNALQFEQIQNFNLTLQQKVDDATHRLRRTNEKLKALDETKDDFISMASHQLRTPLTSVKGYVSMVLDGDAGKVSTQQKALLEQAFTSSQRMVYLIADLLNVSRLKTGKFIIQPVLTNMADMVEGEISQLKETAKGRNLELTYDKPKNFPILMIDETKVRQVIMNFADNAIYYTPAGGHIKIELSETPTTVEYRVIDDGIGVPKNEQHHLFSKFYRAGNAKKARPDGTGLGLFMAQKVIIAQSGAVIFNSQEGKGSTFGFSFPKAKLQPTKIHPTSTET